MPLAFHYPLTFSVVLVVSKMWRQRTLFQRFEPVIHALVD